MSPDPLVLADIAPRPIRIPFTLRTTGLCSGLVAVRFHIPTTRLRRHLMRDGFVTPAATVERLEQRRLLASDLASYVQTNLVSNQPGVAELTDPVVVNAWGISFGPTTPFWLSDNGTGLSTLYTGDAGGGAGPFSKVAVTVA